MAERRSRKPEIEPLRDPQTLLGGRIVPQNLEAEEAVLGALLVDKEGMHKVVDILRPEDFYRVEHELIYRGIVALFDRRDPIDLLTITNQLERTKELDQVGGQARLSLLVARVATATNIAYYAQIIREKAMLRRLISAAATIGELGFREDMEPPEIVDQSEQALFAVTERFLSQNFSSVGDILAESFERLSQVAQEGVGMRGVATGFRHLDGLLGGFQKSDLIIIAARPSMGKTAFALNIAENAALLGKKVVGVFSLEMAKEQLVDRLISSIGKIDSWKLRNAHLTDDDFEKLNEAYGRLAEAKVFIDDAAGASVTEVRAKARRLQAEHGLDLLIIDYLQLMRGSQQYASDRTQEVSEISRSLKALAKELQIPVVALSQLSRAVESRPDKRPLLSDLRESGGIEQDADVVMFLYRDDYYNKEEQTNLMDVLVRKHRNGPTGDIKVMARLQYSRFETVDHAHQPEG